MRFRDRLTADMPEHFTMPEEFLTLADWSEEQGYTRGFPRGEGFTEADIEGVIGFIADPEIHETADVTLYGADKTVMNWSNSDRLYPVGNTGGDGSYFCLWIDDEGKQQVVHMGSGSGSTLWAVFPSALAVLRLFTVGYFTPAFNDDWDAPPDYSMWESTRDVTDSALAPYRRWLKERWGQDTPTTGVEALGLTPEEAGKWTGVEGTEPFDLFDAWLQMTVDS